MKRKLLAVAVASLFALPGYASFTPASNSAREVAATMNEPFPYGHPVAASASFTPASTSAHDVAATMNEPFPYGHPAAANASLAPTVASK